MKTILSSSARRTGEGVQGVRKRGANCTPAHPFLFRNLYHYIGADTPIDALNTTMFKASILNFGSREMLV